MTSKIGEVRNWGILDVDVKLDCDIGSRTLISGHSQNKGTCTLARLDLDY